MPAGRERYLQQELQLSKGSSHDERREDFCYNTAFELCDQDEGSIVYGHENKALIFLVVIRLASHLSFSYYCMVGHLSCSQNKESFCHLGITRWLWAWNVIPP